MKKAILVIGLILFGALIEIVRSVLRKKITETEDSNTHSSGSMLKVVNIGMVVISVLSFGSGIVIGVAQNIIADDITSCIYDGGTTTGSTLDTTGQTQRKTEATTTTAAITAPKGNYPPKFDRFLGSSYYYIDNNNKGLVRDAFDGDIATSWQDGVAGYGEGEWLMAEAYDLQTVSSITIWNGYQNSKYPHLYADNGRVKNITVIWENGQQSFVLKDVKEAQTFHFDTTVVTRYIKIRIDSVYPGERSDEFQDTAIAEISFS